MLIRARSRGRTAFASAVAAGGPGGGGESGDESNFIATWDSFWSQGERISSGNGNGTVAISYSSDWLSEEYAPMWQMLDGTYNGGGPYYGGFTATADSTDIRWRFDRAVKICGLRFLGGDGGSFGYWMPQRSDDGGVTWVDLAASALHWNNTSDGISPAHNGFGMGVDWAFDSDTASQDYRIVFKSGNVGANRRCHEVEFKIKAHPMAGGGQRVANGLVFTCSRDDRNDRPLANLFNGKTAQDNSFGDYNSFGGYALGQYWQFAFPSKVLLKRFYTALGFDNNDQLGHWQFSYSDDGTTWTNAGSEFAPTNSRQAIWDGGVTAADGPHTHWRVTRTRDESDYLVGGVSEIVFDLANG